jgi:BCD family chlorophyll transporter-like MFS transporter
MDTPATLESFEPEPSATSEPVSRSLRWLGICRLGLVQAALGSVVVLLTSTLNRVMVVEYALPAVLPGLLVALHYAVQFIRPRFGFESDVLARRTPWIIGGMAVLAVGGVCCALSTVMLLQHPLAGLLLAILSYGVVGLGVGAAGTSLLVLVANRVDGPRRAAAATIMWILMIAGFAITSTVVGRFLDPFSPQRLVLAMLTVATVAFVVTLLATWNIEGASADAPGANSLGSASVGTASARVGTARTKFSVTLKRVWSEPRARNFTLFVFISMLAYSAQELLLEPFAGLVFGYSLGASAQLSGLWHASALVGMICVGVACSGRRRFGSLHAWTVGGCIGSGIALLSLAAAGLMGPTWPLRLSVMALGAANGSFAVAAIASMMDLSRAGDTSTAGVRMGLWGAAQAVAFACGGLAGTAIVDIARNVFGSPVTAFAIVFAAEAGLFFLASRFVIKTDAQSTQHSAQLEAVSL